MDDALVVGGGQRVGDGDAVVKDLRQGKTVGRQDLVQALAFDQFHGEKAHTCVFLHGIERDDVWMVQARDRLRFALEALEAGGVGGHVGVKNLEGHVAIEARVAGAVHLAHSAFAQLVEDAIGSRISPTFIASSARASARPRRSSRSISRAKAGLRRR